MKSLTLLSSAFAALLMFTTGVAAQLDPGTTDPNVIMRAVHARDAGDRMKARARMEITGSGSARTRSFLLRSLNFPGGVKRLILFEGPADVRNTALLTQDFDDGKREDNQWLYLPSVRQVTRIASTRRSGAFVGSDFSFADLTLPDPALYTHRLRGQETVDGEATWVIESVPMSSATENETGYSKVETWISKRHLIPLRVKAAMPAGRSKYITATHVRVIQGIATPLSLTARVVHAGKVESQTVLTQLEVRYDDESIDEAELTTQRMERGL